VRPMGSQLPDSVGRASGAALFGAWAPTTGLVRPARRNVKRFDPVDAQFKKATRLLI